MMALLASLLISTNATPAEIVASCRAMLPERVTLSGRVILRSRRGIVRAEHAYTLARTNAVSTLRIDGEPLAMPADSGGNVLGTDVTWSDLTLDYLWWDEAAFDAEREGESVHGQVCTVLVLRRGERAVRIWVDRKTGALMQAEELAHGQPVRRLWGTRIRKFGERWMANVMEVETLGSDHRTKITVEELQ